MANRSRLTVGGVLPLLAAVGLLLIFLAAGCGRGGEDAPSSEQGIEHAADHDHPTYVCPMHPNIVRDEPGRCPICGMDLVAKETGAAEAATEHAAAHDHPTYVCPMHPNIVRDEPGS